MTSYYKQMEFHSSSLGDELEPIGDSLVSQSSTYLIHSKLGEGAFGKVAKCYKVATNEIVACKIITANDMTFESQNELDVLKRLKNFDADRYNFVKFNDAFMYNNHVCMDFEMLDMSLYDMMMKRPERSFSVNEIRPILHQVATTLEFLQSQDIVHTDLKSDNIMLVDHVKQPLQVKVIDFGLACTSAYFGQVLYLQALAYRAPEVILGLPFTSAIDMWGLGCIAAELFLGDLLFPATSEYNMLQHIIQTRGELPQKLLREGTRTQKFFIRKTDGAFCRPRWVLMDPDWYDEEEHTDISSICLDDLLALKMPLHKTEENMAEYEDLKDFFELLKKMLDVDPEKRITPRELLQDPFMTMRNVEHRNPDSFYLISCCDMMEACQGQNLDVKMSRSDNDGKTAAKRIDSDRQRQTDRQIHRNRQTQKRLRQNDADGHKQRKGRHRQIHGQIETQAERQREKDNTSPGRQRRRGEDAEVKALWKEQAWRSQRDSRSSQTRKVKPATKIWLIGSSYIRRGEEAACQKFGENLGLNAKVEWFGKGGMGWSGVLPRFYSEMSTQSPPDILVVHAGGNDLGLTSAAELTAAMQRDLMQLHREFPHMKILLSSINERQAWRYGPIKRIITDRKFVNAKMRKAAKGFGGVIIEHPFLRHYNDTLYLPDGVHFTRKGNHVFTSSIRAAVKETLKQTSL